MKRLYSTMTSLEIAEITDKSHAHVLRDIDNTLKSLNPRMALGFKSTAYIDVTGKSNRMFELDRDSSYCLVAGYDVNARMRIIKRWTELESKHARALPNQDIAALKMIKPAILAAKALGFKDQNAIKAADKAVSKITGVSPLELFGQYPAMITAPKIEECYYALTTEQLADALGIDTTATIDLLVSAEILLAKGNKRGGIDYTLLPNGKQYGTITNGKYRWDASVLKILDLIKSEA